MPDLEVDSFRKNWLSRRLWMTMMMMMMIMTFIQYMKQVKNYKSHKNGAFKPGKKK